jgi:hypothetical protein
MLGSYMSQVVMANGIEAVGVLARHDLLEVSTPTNA